MDEQLRRIFSQIFGFSALDFQIDTIKRLLGETNVILQAPTGAGKTYAALFPFLYGGSALT